MFGWNYRLVLSALALLLDGRGHAAPSPADSSRTNSGIQTQYFDSNVRPQDDFYRYVNGKWLAATEIPSDRPAYGTATKLFDDSQRQLRDIVEAAAKSTDAVPGSNESKIGTLYNSFLDVARVERLGSTPLAGEFARIRAIQNTRDIPPLIAHLQQLGVTVPYGLSVHLDSKDSTRYVFDVQQDGLGLPDRDYYLRDDATTLRLIRRQYQAHIADSLAKLGDHNAPQEAAAIVALETELARLQWSKTDNLDPEKIYNRVELAELASAAPGYDWHRYLVAAGISGKVNYLILSQPS
jgi:putative endopeptidase